MRRSPSSRCLIAGWLAFLIFPVWAADAPDFLLVPRPVVIPERGPVPGALLIDGANRFSFMLPSDWRVGVNPVDRRVTLQSPDFTGTITVTILPSGTKGLPVLNRDAVRDQLTNQYSGVRILREFECFGAGQRGLGFDLERVVNTNTLAMRVNLLPFDSGSIEFNLTTMRDKITNCNLPFGIIMTSFHVEPRLAKP